MIFRLVNRDRMETMNNAYRRTGKEVRQDQKHQASCLLGKKKRQAKKKHNKSK